MTRTVSLRIITAILVASFSLGAYAAVNDASVKIKWGYKGNLGPAYWGKLSPDFAVCANGKAQSPINITSDIKKAVSNLSVAYQLAPMSIIDDGITDLMMGNNRVTITSNHSIQLNFSGRRVKETIRIGDTKYDLLEFHMHSPSENQWHGQSFPMEIHFVHQSADGQVAVIGVFVKAGKPNGVFEKIIKHLPKEEDKEYYIEEDPINPAGLLPEKQDYYTFTGSLTTPPCSEGLHWLVMETPITASPAQINIIRVAAGGENARPVQSLNGREVSFAARKE